MRHADLRRDTTTVIAKAASALLYDTAVWFVPGMGVWACGEMSDAMGSKKMCKKIPSELSTDRSSRKSRVFRLDPPVGKRSRKKLSRKNPFSTV